MGVADSADAVSRSSQATHGISIGRSAVSSRCLDGEPLPPLTTTSVNDIAAARRSHASTKSVSPLTPGVMWLIRTLHCIPRTRVFVLRPNVSKGWHAKV